MKRFSAIPALISALYQGRQLADVETWKNRGLLITLVSGVLTAAVGLAVAFGWMEEVSPSTIMEVSSAMVTIVLAVLGYLQVATTDKIGLPAPPDDSPDAGRVYNNGVPADDSRGAFRVD